MGLNLLATLWNYGRVMEQRLRQKAKIVENQFGFMLERSTMKASSQLDNLWKILREEVKSSYGLHQSKEIL